MKAQLGIFAGTLAILLLFPNLVRAQDCTSSSQQSIQHCDTTTNMANAVNAQISNSLVLSSANAVQGAINEGQASSAGSGNLIKAQASCQTDFDTCQRVCNNALALNPTAVGTITSNLNKCKLSIQKNISDLSAGTANLQVAQQGSGNSANLSSSQSSGSASPPADSSADNSGSSNPSCAEGDVCGTKNPDIQNANTTNLRQAQINTETYGPGTVSGSRAMWTTPNGPVYVDIGPGMANLPAPK